MEQRYLPSWYSFLAFTLNRVWKEEGGASNGYGCIVVQLHAIYIVHPKKNKGSHQNGFSLLATLLLLGFIDHKVVLEIHFKALEMGLLIFFSQF
ncbi:hypothetical protein TorRG33x02_246970 [Trema orientale]|uniref:Uncharacterized protein n=1 Tax=Trema orientale TaxID=63057 RepID=A0A2P5DMZ7_TREOI|nr:hypothetical protein TorRG33x02_246970 [Trema orientale]